MGRFMVLSAVHVRTVRLAGDRITASRKNSAVGLESLSRDERGSGSCIYRWSQGVAERSPGHHPLHDGHGSSSFCSGGSLSQIDLVTESWNQFRYLRIGQPKRTIVRLYRKRFLLGL